MTQILLPLIIIVQACTNTGFYWTDTGFVDDCGEHVAIHGAGSPETLFSSQLPTQALIDSANMYDLNAMYAVLDNTGGDDNDVSINPYMDGTVIFDWNRLDAWKKIIDDNPHILFMLFLSEVENAEDVLSERYVITMVRQLEADNVVWLVSEEVDGSLTPQVHREWVALIREHTDRPVMAHNYQQRQEWFNVNYGDWVDDVAWQTWDSAFATELAQTNDYVFIAEGKCIHRVGIQWYYDLPDHVDYMVFDCEHDQRMYGYSHWFPKTIELGKEDEGNNFVKEGAKYVPVQLMEGNVSGYAQDVMKESIAFWDNINPPRWCGFGCRGDAQFDGYIVLIDCNDVGRTVLLHTRDKVYKVLVTDCIAQQHLVEGNILTRYVGEVDYDLFQLLRTEYIVLEYAN